MTNPSGLQQELGLKDPQGPSCGPSQQAAQFKASFQASMKKVNESLQYTAVNTEKTKHDAVATKRSTSCTQYQNTLSQIDPEDASKAQSSIDLTLAVVADLALEAKTLQDDTKKALEAWGEKESELATAWDQLNELAEWQYDVATLKKDYSAIEQDVTNKRYDDAVKACDALTAKLSPFMDDLKTQKDAKESYDKQYQAIGSEVNNVVMATPPDAVKQTHSEITKTKTDMEKAATDSNYVCAESLIATLPALLKTYKEADDKAKQKEEYEEQLKLLTPRLEQAAEMTPPSLKSERDDMLSKQKAMEASASSEDYPAATSQAAALIPVVDAYVKAALADREDKAKWVDDRKTTLQEMRTQLSTVRESANEDAKAATKKMEATTTAFSDFESRFNGIKAEFNDKIEDEKARQEIYGFAFEVAVGAAFGLATGGVGTALKGAQLTIKIAAEVAIAIAEEGSSELFTPFDGAGLESFQGGSGVEWASFCKQATTMFGKYTTAVGDFNKIDKALDDHITWLQEVDPETLDGTEPQMDKIDKVAGAKGKLGGISPDSASQMADSTALAAKLKAKSDLEIRQSIAIRWIAGLKEDELDAIDAMEDYLTEIKVISQKPGESALGVNVGDKWTSEADEANVHAKAAESVVKQLVGKKGKWNGGSVQVGGKQYPAHLAGPLQGEPASGSPVTVTGYVPHKKTSSRGRPLYITFSLNVVYAEA